MAFILTADQQVSVSFTAKDKYQNDAKIDGVPVWSSSDDAIVTVTPAADGMSALVVAVGPVGTAQVSVRADADMTEGSKEIVGMLDLEILASEATVVALSAASAVPKPTAETPVEPTPDVPVEPVPEEPAPVDPTEPAPPVDGGDVPVEPPPVEEVPGDTDTPRSRRRR